jgi:dihydrofolate reductase
MRKLIISNIVSLDGFVAGPGNDVMALPMDDAFDSYNAERLRAADTLLLGRASYEMFKAFWPGVADDPAGAAARLGVPVEYIDTPQNREISRLENAIEKVVVSDGLRAGDTDPWRATTTIVRRADAHDAVRNLKAREGGEILTFASRTLWNDLLAAGLVDELHLMVGPLALGAGAPAFTAPAQLRLLGTRRFDGSENFLVRYAAEPVTGPAR